MREAKCMCCALGFITLASVVTSLPLRGRVQDAREPVVAVLVRRGRGAWARWGLGWRGGLPSARGESNTYQPSVSRHSAIHSLGARPG
eukprot:3792983-Prymnesium_polylepis.1